MSKAYRHGRRPLVAEAAEGRDCCIIKHFSISNGKYVLIFVTTVQLRTVFQVLLTCWFHVGGLLI